MKIFVVTATEIEIVEQEEINFDTPIFMFHRKIPIGLLLVSKDPIEDILKFALKRSSMHRLTTPIQWYVTMEQLTKSMPGNYNEYSFVTFREIS